MVTLEGTKRGRHPTRYALALGEDPECKRSDKRTRTAPRSYGRWWRPHGPSVRSGRRSSNSFGCPCCCQIALVSRILPSRPLRPPARRSPPSAPPLSATAPAQGPPGAQGCEGDNEGYQDQANVCWCCLHASFEQMQGHTLQACTLTQAPWDALRPALMPWGVFFLALEGPHWAVASLWLYVHPKVAL